MQFRIYDRQTLAYKDGGHVASYTIDDDYIVNNNSSIKIIKPVKETVVIGDIIALIETSGAYHKGVITTVDNADFTITYKGDRELFNDNILNPEASKFAEDNNVKVSSRFGIEIVAALLKAYFADTNDWAVKLPLKIITEGDVTDSDGNGAMLWNWSDSSINVTDWLISLFERYNLVLNWTIDFNISANFTTEISNGKIVVDGNEIITIDERKPQYIVTLSAVTNGGKIIKDNAENQIITYTEKELPESTVCVIIDKDSKEVIQLSSGKNLYNPATVSKNTILQYYSDYNGMEEKYSAGSDTSGFIKVKQGDSYTLSFTKYDGLGRNIYYYKDKNTPVAYYTYNHGNAESTSDRAEITVTIPTQVAGTELQINYARIVTYYLSEEIQFEKGSSATAFDSYSHPSIYYLTDEDGVEDITTDIESEYRVLPVRTKIVEFDSSGEDTTPEQVARENLIPSKFNQSIEIQISKDSKLFDFENALYGELYKIINEQGAIESNYTGRKEESGNKWVTLYFGLGRQNYTALMQLRLRKARYKVLYNQGK